MSQPPNPPITPVEDILDITAAAVLVKLKPSTIYALTSKRKIPHYKRGGKLYFRQSELVAWLSEGYRPVVNGSSADAHLRQFRKGVGND